MSRAKYTDAERNSIMDTFLESTRQVIEAEGVDGVSIRKVASTAGYNSATLYLYFKDVDELITLALMSYLEEHALTLSRSCSGTPSAIESFLNEWDLLCDLADKNPSVYYRLLFTRREWSLGQAAKRYYSIYSSRFEELDSSVRELMLSGDMHERIHAILRPLVSEGIISEENRQLTADMLTAYFRTLLERLLDARENGTDPEGSLSEQMRTAIRFLLHIG